MNPVIARAGAAVGLVLGLVSIWTKLYSISGPYPTPTPSRTYWNIDPNHGVGIALLVLSILAAIGLLLALVLGSPVFDRLWLLAGTLLGGMLLFIPIAYWTSSSSESPHLGVGGWLGGAAFVLFALAGAVLPLSASPRSLGVATEPAAPLVPEVVEQRDAVREEEHGEDDG